MRRLLFIASLGLVTMLGFGFWFVEGTTTSYLVDQPEKKEFYVEKGTGAVAIAEDLKAQGLISNRWLFVLYVLFQQKQGQLQAGTYTLSPAMSISEIAEKIIAGEAEQERITIIEGWNLMDIAWHLEGRGLFQAEEMFDVTGYPLVEYPNPEMATPKDFSQDFDFLKDKPKVLGLEGYIFPDTYNIVGADGPEELVLKALDNFGRKFNPQLRAEIEGHGKSIFEIVTMASLLEKEVSLFEDRRLVSGILWKRLEAGVPLQVDATISYITGKKTTKVSKKETEIDSPYNTYKDLGLPKGPISNPGLESIQAAIYPEESNFWYYLSTPEGDTIFSQTLEQHNIAKEKYLK